MSQSTPQRCKIRISVSGPSREYQSQGSAVTFVPLTIKRKHPKTAHRAPLVRRTPKSDRHLTCP